MYEALQLTLGAIILLSLIYAAVVVYALSRAETKDVPAILKEANAIFLHLIDHLPGVRRATDHHPSGSDGAAPLDEDTPQPALDGAPSTEESGQNPTITQTPDTDNSNPEDQ